MKIPMKLIFLLSQNLSIHTHIKFDDVVPECGICSESAVEILYLIGPWEI